MVECLEIREQSVIVRIEGEAKPRELKLGEVETGTFKSVINPGGSSIYQSQLLHYGARRVAVEKGCFRIECFDRSHESR